MVHELQFEWPEAVELSLIPTQTIIHRLDKLFCRGPALCHPK